MRNGIGEGKSALLKRVLDRENTYDRRIGIDVQCLGVGCAQHVQAVEHGRRHDTQRGLRARREARLYYPIQK